MATLRSIRKSLTYTHVLRLDRFGHLYIPVSLGALRSVAFPEKDGVRLTLNPSSGLYVHHLFAMPKPYWDLVLPEKGELRVFFRRDGDKLRAFVPFIRRRKP
jgi:hypothetical protein